LDDQHPKQELVVLCSSHGSGTPFPQPPPTHCSKPPPNQPPPQIGQLSSTRSDLFPADFVEELAKLQDRVPAFSADKAIAIIEKDLGRPIGQLFREFDRQPVAAASLGQVHRAVLFSGEEVSERWRSRGLAA
jgi:hypothetical protein